MDPSDITEEKQKYRPQTWEKGQSGNPLGRPRGSFSLIGLLRNALTSVSEGSKQSYAEAMIKSMLHKAIIEKDHSSQKLIMNYVEGMPKKRVDFDVDKESLAELTSFFRSMSQPSV